MSKVRTFEAAGIKGNLLSDEEALARTYTTLDFVESAVKSQLKRLGYPQDCYSLLRMSGTSKADDRQRGSSIATFANQFGPDENEFRPVPQQIIDLGGCLVLLSTLRAHLSAGRIAEAVHDMHYATILAMRGEAELFDKEQKSAHGRARGHRSGVERRRKASQAWPVLDAYLARAAKGLHDGTKTGLAKRAHRMLSRHCGLWRQSQEGNKIAEQRFSDEATNGLRELLQDDWTPLTMANILQPL